MSIKLSKGMKLVATMMGDKLEGLGLPKLKVNLIKTKISHTQGVCVRENDQEKGVRGVNPNPQETIKLKKDFSLN